MTEYYIIYWTFNNNTKSKLFPVHSLVNPFTRTKKEVNVEQKPSVKCKIEACLHFEAGVSSKRRAILKVWNVMRFL
jgi:hypothetical protein